MKTMTEPEIDAVIQQHQSLLGAELTQIVYSEKALQLQLKREGRCTWLTFSMKPGVPYLFLTDNRIFLQKTMKKPVGLFLKTHFMGRSLSRIQRLTELGRVVTLEFTADDPCQLHFSLVTGRVNIEVQYGDKKVSAFKPKPLAAKPNTADWSANERSLRDSEFFEQAWREQNSSSSASAPVDQQKALKKKRQGLKKMQAKLSELDDDRWRRCGEWLKTQQSLEDPPSEFVDLLDSQQSLSWNVENCFQHSKKNTLKRAGTEQRVSDLKKEIEDLESSPKRSVPKKPQAANLLAQADLKGKTHQLAEGKVYVGKSGADNLKLLRKAKPWYLWLHIKDYPGAYGILERNKSAKVSNKSLQEAGRAVVRQSLPQSASGLFEVLYTECRYVRPIKGAKSGQVTYSHEKVITVRIEK